MHEYTTEEMLAWCRSDNLELERELTEQRNEIKALQKELEEAYEKKLGRDFLRNFQELRAAEKQSQEAWDNIIRLRKKIGNCTDEPQQYIRMGAMDAVTEMVEVAKNIARDPAFRDCAEKIKSVVEFAARTVSMTYREGDDGHR